MMRDIYIYIIYCVESSLVQHCHDARYILKSSNTFYTWQVLSFRTRYVRVCLFVCLSVCGIARTFLSFLSLVHVSWCRLARVARPLVDTVRAVNSKRRWQPERRNPATDHHVRRACPAKNGYRLLCLWQRSWRILLGDVTYGLVDRYRRFGSTH